MGHNRAELNEILQYARWTLVAGLLPSIRAAHAAGEDARVMAVFSAVQGVELDLTDRGLKKALKPVRDFRGFVTAGGQASTYVDLAFKVYCGGDTWNDSLTHLEQGLRRTQPRHHVHPCASGAGDHRT
jgi:hypothetical protein